MKKKGIIIGVVAVVLICAGIGGWYLLKEKGGESNSDEVAYVQSVGSITGANGFGVQNRYSGVVEAQETWDVKLHAEKTVAELYVEEGQEVEVGTPLFIYDTQKMETDLAQAELDLEKIDNSISETTQNITQLEKEKKAASKDEQLNFTIQIQTAEMDIKTYEFEKKAKNVEIEQLKNSIENATVTCEMEGVIKSINKDNSTNSNGEVEPYISVLATGDFRIKGKVNEQNMSAIAEGMGVIVHSRVDDSQLWTGILNKLDIENPTSDNSNMYSYSSSDSSELSTSYPFYITLDSSEGLKLGQHVYIELDLGQTEVREGLWLDESFIVMEDDSTYVWAANDKEKLIKKQVTLGEYDDQLYQYEILDGLTLEDMIAMPDEYLKEGMTTVVGEMGMSADMLEEDMMYEDGEMPEGEVIFDGEVIYEDGEIPEGGFTIDGEIPEGGFTIDSEATYEEDIAPQDGEVINGELDMNAETSGRSDTEGGQ